jgi:hypothetical protein
VLRRPVETTRQFRQCVGADDDRDARNATANADRNNNIGLLLNPDIYFEFCRLCLQQLSCKTYSGDNFSRTTGVFLNVDRRIETFTATTFSQSQHSST